MEQFHNGLAVLIPSPLTSWGKARAISKQSERRAGFAPRSERETDSVIQSETTVNYFFFTLAKPFITIPLSCATYQTAPTKNNLA